MADTERMERLLALILLNQMKGGSQREKVIELNRAGFSNLEIADLLQTTTAVVSQQLYEARRTGGRRKSSAKKKPSTKRS